MRMNKRILGYCVLSVVILLALIVLALPPIIKHVAVKQIDQATGRKSEIGKISLNPFTLSVGISGFRLSDKGNGATFLALSSARLSLSPLSLPKRSFIISEVKISSPYLHIVRNAPNSFNFSDLVSGKKEQKKGGTPLFSLNNIVIDNGSLDFQDKALKVEKFHRIRKMAVSVPFVSNMPYLADRYVSPHFSAIINDAPFRFDGRLKPLTRAVEATLTLNVKHLDLPFYLGYLPVPPPVKVASGRLSTALELGYRVDEKSGPEVRLTGTVALDGAAVNELTGAPLAALDRVQLKINNALLLSRHLDLASLELNGLELFAARDRFGVWNFQKIGQSPKSGNAKTQAPAAEKKPLDLKLAKFAYSKGTVHFSDSFTKQPFKTDLQDIAVSLDNFALDSGRRAPFELNLKSSKGENLSLKGELAASPLDVKAALSLTGVPLKDYYPYLIDTLSAPISGSLDFSSELLYNERQGLVIENSSLKAKELTAPFGKGDGFRLKEAAVSGIKVDLKQKKAAVARVDLRGGNFTISSEKDGTVSPQRLLRAKQEPAAAKPQSVPTKKSKAKQPTAPAFSYRIEKVNGSELGVKFTDRSKEDEPVFALNRIKFSLAGISGPRQGAIPFSFAAGYSNKGRIAAAGAITPQPLKFKGNVELQGIALRDFDAYLPENLTVFIADGALDTKLALNLEKVAAGMKGNFGGSVGVRSFYCQDTVLDEDLLKWERLQIDKVKGTLGPFTLAVADVSLSNFYSRIIVQSDGTLNLQHLMAEQPQEAQANKPATAATSPGAPPAKPSSTAPAAPPAKPAAAAGHAAPFSKPELSAPSGATPPTSAAATKVAPETPPQAPAVSINTVTLQGGTLAFSDRHLQAPFDTTFFNLGGKVSGLTSEASRVANVDLRGNLENHSPLSITGVINPLRGDLFLDMKVTFHDIELSPFTPYSNTFLGYNVDKGKLFLDLTYHIEKKTLSSQNKVFLDQFTLGKAVQSEKATKLPVRLAIALLKDRKGEIHLDLPVGGRTDDPQFSVWKVVGQILKNLLVKAATAPFALLGSMFGGSEDFSAVYFAPGSDKLATAEQEKLKKLAKALQDRPALNMEISGFVDRNRDSEGYRNELLLKKMKGEKFRALVKQGKIKEGQTQEELELLPAENHVYLSAVYGKEKFPKPRNVLGIAKELPDDEMKKLILAHTAVGENELRALARERSDAVKAFLQKQGGIATERLFEKNADIYKPSSKEGSSGSRVEFGASVK